MQYSITPDLPPFNILHPHNLPVVVDGKEWKSLTRFFCAQLSPAGIRESIQNSDTSAESMRLMEESQSALMDKQLSSIIWAHYRPALTESDINTIRKSGVRLGDGTFGFDKFIQSVLVRKVRGDSTFQDRTTPPVSEFPEQPAATKKPQRKFKKKKMRMRKVAVGANTTDPPLHLLSSVHWVPYPETGLSAYEMIWKSMFEAFELPDAQSWSQDEFWRVVTDRQSTILKNSVIPAVRGAFQRDPVLARVFATYTQVSVHIVVAMPEKTYPQLFGETMQNALFSLTRVYTHSFQSYQPDWNIPDEHVDLAMEAIELFATSAFENPPAITPVFVDAVLSETYAVCAFQEKSPMILPVDLWFTKLLENNYNRVGKKVANQPDSVYLLWRYYAFIRRNSAKHDIQALRAQSIAQRLSDLESPTYVYRVLRNLLRNIQRVRIRVALDHRLRESDSELVQKLIGFSPSSSKVFSTPLRDSIENDLKWNYITAYEQVEEAEDGERQTRANTPAVLTKLSKTLAILCTQVSAAVTKKTVTPVTIIRLHYYDTDFLLEVEPRD